MAPLLPLLQDVVRLRVTAVGSVMSPVVVAVQLLASVTVKEYVPAERVNVPVPV